MSIREGRGSSPSCVSSTRELGEVCPRSLTVARRGGRVSEVCRGIGDARDGPGIFREMRGVSGRKQFGNGGEWRGNCSNSISGGRTMASGKFCLRSVQRGEEWEGEMRRQHLREE